MTQSLASRIQAAHAELIDNRNLDAVGAFFAPDYVGHGTDRDLKGQDAVRKFLDMILRAFPDLEVDVEVLLEGEERIAWQRTLRGAHEGDFMGFPASGRSHRWRDMVTSRFHDGRIAEEWVITDMAEHLLLARKG